MSPCAGQDSRLLSGVPIGPRIRSLRASASIGRDAEEAQKTVRSRGRIATCRRQDSRGEGASGRCGRGNEGRLEIDQTGRTLDFGRMQVGTDSIEEWAGAAERTGRQGGHWVEVENARRERVQLQVRVQVKVGRQKASPPVPALPTLGPTARAGCTQCSRVQCRAQFCPIMC